MGLSAIQIVKRQEDLQGSRGTWDDHWRQVAELIWPEGNEFRGSHAPGEKRSDRVFDAVPARALEKFAAALESLLTPRSQFWHRLRASSVNAQIMEVQSVREWYERATDILFQVRQAPGASFYSQLSEGYKGMGAFGSLGLLVEPASNRRGIRYRNIHIGELFVEQDADGNIDTVFRRYKMTAKRAMQRFGIDNLPRSIQRKLDTDPFSTSEYIHAVVPRDLVNPRALGPERMPFEAYHVSVDGKEFVAPPEGQFEQSYIVSRYSVNPNEVYGRGPGMIALADIKTLNSQMKTMLRSGHKIGDPPLLVADSVQFGNGATEVRTSPNALNFGGLDSQGRPLIAPLLTGARLDITADMMAEKREAIQDAFLVTLFRILVEQPNMTATEALLRAQEKGQLLAPTVGRQQTELLGPMITREVNLLDRMGLLPPMPDELLELGGEFEAEYESEVTRAAKTTRHLAIAETIQIGAPFIEQDPSLLDIWDSPKLLREVYEDKGGQMDLMRDDQEFQQLQQARNEAAQEQAALDAAPGAASALKDVSAVIPAA